MITWMQKNNKYLVWTIWIATIAFIGAGFVGWGSYDLGSKAGNVAKVGTIEIDQGKLNRTYSRIYNQYNERLQGQLDEEKAKELKIVQRAFKELETKAKILNFAKDMGIIVSENEIAQKIQDIPSFQENGVFNKKIYDKYLSMQRIKGKDFDETLKEELIIQKTLALLTVGNLDFEEEGIAAAMNVADKLAYKVLSENDLDFILDENKIKEYWEVQKENFSTSPMYVLSIIWTESKDTSVDEAEIQAHYDLNSFNYTNATGKQLSFKEAKEIVTKDLKLKKTKKTAGKAYVSFKNGRISADENITLPLDDQKLTEEIWAALKSADMQAGKILKPKVIAQSYATIKINQIIPARIKTYKEAKKEASTLYIIQAKKEALFALAENTLKNFDEKTAIVSDFVKLEENVNLKALNSEESLHFLEKLFTSMKEKGIISVSDKVIVYNIIEQKLLPIDENQTNVVKQTVNRLKQSTFESNLIKVLDTKYPTEVYIGGLIN
ncbi:MAG: hypothetical protein DRQ78_02250 [Epsilonproteobacteria bacterium]|nr:MAG: hypothetical protein DRQ78_02250 [Campylobacterota bacterium]